MVTVTKTTTGNLKFLFALAIVAGAGAPAHAQDAAAPALRLELNALEASDKGCRMAFVVQNGLDKNIAKAAYEIALFNKQGLVDRLMVLDFQDLPANKTKVRRFDLTETDCSDIGRVLINDASSCEGDGIEPGDCIGLLTTSTRGDVEFGT